MKQKVDITRATHIHFIGIGGIGISAIARMVMIEGKRVSGSDQSEGEVVKELKKLNAKIAIGHRAENVPKNCDLVIYTIAIPKDNPELVLARKQGIQCLTYPEALGQISASKYTIAVAGTHGKTTTTAMLAKIFLDAKKDPTVVVGSLLVDQKSNFIAGKSEYFITEACEYRRSFLNLNPKVLIITNIDNDHLDYYKDLKDIQSAFVSLAEKLPEDGLLVCDVNDVRLKPVIKSVKCLVIDYSSVTENIKLKSPGAHNISNAKAALAVAAFVGIKKINILKSLKNFAGTWRRFEYKGKNKKGAMIYDDYAHHPTEVRAALAGARLMYPKKNIVVAFMPHLYSRTKLLLNDFAKSFDKADRVIVAPIYAAREQDPGDISSADLAKKLLKRGKKAETKNLSEIAEIIKTENKNSVVVTMGAGDIYKTITD